MRTQHQKILNIMATNPDRWWLPQDFMQTDLGDNFVDYEASARLSELAKMGEVESRREGKYMARKLIVKTVHKGKSVGMTVHPTEQANQQAFLSVAAEPRKRDMPR